MKTLGLILFVGSLIEVAISAEHKDETTKRKLVVFHLDGFKWDYFDKAGVTFTGFKRIFARGVKAKYMIPTFPTVTYASLYTLMTGLYPESHGMVDNYMYDPIRNESFIIGTNPEQFHAHWWDSGDPIWITAKRQGKSTYMYDWPGCEVEIRGLRPDYCTTWSHPPTNAEFRDTIIEALDRIQADDADIAAIYTDTLDSAGHMFGLNDDRIDRFLQDVDDSIGFFIDELERRNLQNDVDVMYIADHGMADISDSRLINITRSITDDCERVIYEWAHAQIWPKPGMLESVYNRLTALSDKMTTYKKEDIPERWHYKNHYLVPPIFSLAKIGWSIIINDDGPLSTYNKSGFAGTYSGTHGYDNNEEEMRNIFFAMGPSFKKSHVIEPIQSVELYQIMCKVLEIDPSPHNGTWANVADAMADTSASATLRYSCEFIALLITGVLYMLY